MERHGRIDPVTREKAYRDGGWSAFDENSAPYTPADVARERALYSTRRLDLTAEHAPEALMRLRA